MLYNYFSLGDYALFKRVACQKKIFVAETACSLQLTARSLNGCIPDKKLFNLQTALDLKPESIKLWQQMKNYRLIC